MRTRLSLMLALALMTTGMSQPSIKSELPAAFTQEAELTPEEEQVAREVAVHFMKRLSETDDFGPLITEFFAEDFIERLRQLVRAANPLDDLFMFSAREVILQASEDDLRRVYLALMNFWNQQRLLSDAAWDYVKVQYRIEGKDALQEQEAWGQKLKLREEAVPEEAFRIAQSDPLIDSLFNLVRQDKGVEDEESPEIDEAKIKSFTVADVARLRAFTDKLERSTSLLRSGVEKLRAKTKTLALNCVSEKPQDEELNSDDEFRIYHFESETVEEETFGLPAGTILIRARIYPYEMALARVDGQLKILAVYPDIDGD